METPECVVLREDEEGSAGRNWFNLVDRRLRLDFTTWLWRRLKCSFIVVLLVRDVLLLVFIFFSTKVAFHLKLCFALRNGYGYSIWT